MRHFTTGAEKHRRTAGVVRSFCGIWIRKAGAATMYSSGGGVKVPKNPCHNCLRKAIR